MRTAARFLLLAAGGLALPGFLGAQPAVWTPAGPGGGGALFVPSWSPHVPGEIYIASDMSEVFHSTDTGAHWSVLDWRQIRGGSRARVSFTSDPRILYAIDHSFDAPSPTRSDDGGATWTPLPADPTAGDAYTLLADPARTDRLLVSGYFTLYFSDDGGMSFAPVYTDATGNGCYIAGAFFDGQDIYVGTNAGLLVSSDGGGSFSLAPVGGIPAGEVILTLAGAREGATVRLFSVTANEADVYPGLFYAEIYGVPAYRGVYTWDAGQPAWLSRTAGIAADDYLAFVSMSRRNVSIAWLAGQNAIGYPVVYRTTDAGLNWTPVYFPVGNQNIATGYHGNGGDFEWYWGGGAIGFQADPLDTNRAAYTDWGFIHLTTDGGASWRQSYLEIADQNPAGAPTPNGRAYRSVGLEPTSVWDITWLTRDRIIASYTDIRGVVSDDGGTSWSFDYTGHTLNTMYRAVVDPQTGTVYAATSSVHDLYASTYLTDARIDGGQGRVLFSTDQGSAWEVLHDFGHPVVWVELDPTRPNRLYASVVHSVDGGIYVSDDIQNGAASAWTHLPDPPRTEGHPYNIRVLADGAVVVSFSGRRAGSPIRFTDSSGVFLSTDGGLTWIDRTGPNMHAWTKDVVIDPHDPAENTWYAGVFNAWGGFGNDLGGLYVTADRGQSWTRLTSGMSVESCTMNPLDPDEMYVMTEAHGLLRSTDRRSPAPNFPDVLEYPFSHPQRVFWNPHVPGEIWVTSFGNGIRIGRTGGPVGPPPVADGSNVQGAPMRVAKLTPDGADLRIGWDVITCPPAPDYNLLYGTSSALPAYGLTGGVCGMGASGSWDWLGSPAVSPAERFLWWVIVGTDGAGTESSWGRNSSGAERNGATASGQCGVTVKDTSRTCP